MSPKKRHRPSRLASKPEGRKRNSNTLCQTLTEIREGIHLLPIASALGIEKSLSRHDFAEIVLNRAVSRRPEFVGRIFKADNLDNMEGNEQNLRFIDLQLYADIVGIPLGLLLLFSRIKSIKRQKEPTSETVANLFEALQEIITTTVADEPTVSTLAQWAAICEKFGLKTPTTF